MISIVIAVYFTNQLTNSEVFENECYLEQKICTIQLLDTQTSVHFDRYPIVIEDIVHLMIKHSEYFVLQNAWVEGTNMFMGRTNVFIGESERSGFDITHEAELFLGACSEPRMRWKLVLDLTDVRTGQAHQIRVFFQTYYS